MITLFTAKTGNGYRAALMLEELALPYEAVDVDIASEGQKSPAFLKVSPLAKIPAILDPEGPDGTPVAVAESFAIALYLVEKTGGLRPSTAAGRAAAYQWGAIVASGFGAAIPGIFFARRLGEADHAKLIAKYYEDIHRCFQAMDADLAARPYLAGEDYSFADVLAAPLIPTCKLFGVDLEPYPSVRRWRDKVFERPAVSRVLPKPV